jgi:hypothetical protein
MVGMFFPVGRIDRKKQEEFIFLVANSNHYY